MNYHFASLTFEILQASLTDWLLILFLAKFTINKDIIRMVLKGQKGITSLCNYVFDVLLYNKVQGFDLDYCKTRGTVKYCEAFHTTIKFRQLNK